MAKIVEPFPQIKHEQVMEQFLLMGCSCCYCWIPTDPDPSEVE